MTTVIALPGFTRGPAHLQRLADGCAARGWRCLRPRLAPRWLPVLYMRRPHLDAIAERIAPSVGRDPVVVAGHSAGGAAGAYLATRLLDRGIAVRGVVFIDGVESPNHLIARSLPDLTSVRLAAVFAPPSPCNRNGALAAALEDDPRIRTQLIEGAGHGDIEGAGIGVYRRWCRDDSDAGTAERFLNAVLDAITWVDGGA